MSQAQQEAILRGKQETFGEFIWNSERGEFLGRTGTSWMKIFTFYCIYYGFLAAFFAICMILFYQTLDPETLPKYQPGEENSILKNPSMGYRPNPPSDNIESSMITYTSGNKSTYEVWTNSMSDLLTGVEDPNRNYQKDVGGEDGVDCDSTTPLPLEDNKMCKFNMTSLGEGCSAENDFGYATDSPCIILKLNRMIGWVPKVYETTKDLDEAKDMPKQLRQHIDELTTANGGVIPKMLWVSCKGENPMDTEMLGHDITYLPNQGFPYYYFPYMNQKNYLSPLIAVQFKKPKTNVIIHITCAVYAKGMVYNRKEQIGLVNMQLLIDKPLSAF